MKNQSRYIKREEKRTVQINESNFIGYKEVLEDKNFFKLWSKEEPTKELNELNLFFYIIKYMSNQNTINANIKLWAEKFKTTRQRVSRYIRWLEKNNYVKWKTNIIIANPEIIYKGNAYKRSEVIKEYTTFKGQK